MSAFQRAIKRLERRTPLGFPPPVSRVTTTPSHAVLLLGRNGRVDRLSGGRETVRQNTLPLGPFKQLQNASMPHTPLVCAAPTAYQPMESGNVAPAVVATPYEHVVLGVLGLDDVAPDLAPPQGPIVLRAAPWNHYDGTPPATAAAIKNEQGVVCLEQNATQARPRCIPTQQT